MAVALDFDDPLASPDREAARLTAQEQQMLALAATGWSADAVAEALGLPPEAVRRSLVSVIERVGARSKTEAVMIVVRNRLIDLPTEAGRVDGRTRDSRPSAVRPVMRLLR